MGYQKHRIRIGDYVQSFNVICPVDTKRGSFIGRVTDIDLHNDGVKYYFIKADYEIINGELTPCTKEIKVPANGTITNCGNYTDGVRRVA